MLRINALFLVAFALLNIPAWAQDSVYWKALAQEGEVTFTMPGTSTPQTFKLGENIPIGSSVSTGASGSAILQQGASFTLFQIKPNTIVKLEASKVKENKDMDTKIALKKGTVLLKVQKLQGKSTFSVETPLSVGSVRGTDFFVNVSPDGKLVIVYTKQGAVEWRAKPGVVQLRSIMDIRTEKDVPKDVLRALFDYGQEKIVTDKQAFMFLPKDEKDRKYILLDEPISSMEGFQDLISKLSKSDNFDGAPKTFPNVELNQDRLGNQTRDDDERKQKDKDKDKDKKKEDPPPPPPTSTP
ncbi:MAG: FecR family protein [Verrucomicrobiota bacterium]|nr:FecR family protein [Verrucomicrobiota bacterium]